MDTSIVLCERTAGSSTKAKCPEEALVLLTGPRVLCVGRPGLAVSGLTEVQPLSGSLYLSTSPKQQS